MRQSSFVKPVTATPIGNPGMYHARIEIEMYGEWALKIDVSGPTRDRIIHKMHFSSAEVGSGSNETRSPQTYDGVGVVLKVDIEKSRVTVDHEEIEGYMNGLFSVLSRSRVSLNVVINIQKNGKAAKTVNPMMIPK